MTTVGQIKRMVKPLLERHSDLALIGHRIYVKPVRHFARAVLIGRTSSADQFSPRWAVLHLFEAHRFFPVSWGEFLANERSGRRGLWFTSQPDIADALIEAIEEQALPQLRAMRTLDDFLAYVTQSTFRHHLFDWPTARIILDVALGDLDAARVLCESNIENWSTDKPHHDDEDRVEFRRLRELCARLTKDDRTGLARLLHEWEALTVKNFKIEHLWEPTPFPIEIQSAA